MTAIDEWFTDLMLKYPETARYILAVILVLCVVRGMETSGILP